jgi:hypothetical protein
MVMVMIPDREIWTPEQFFKKDEPPVMVNRPKKKRKKRKPPTKPNPLIKQRRRKANLKKWHDYKREVWRLTELQPLHKLPNINKRGFRNYHLDHRVSIFHGFKNGLMPQSIANISNLKMVPWKENCQKKGKKSTGQLIAL